MEINKKKVVKFSDKSLILYFVCDKIQFPFWQKPGKWSPMSSALAMFLTINYSNHIKNPNESQSINFYMKKRRN